MSDIDISDLPAPDAMDISDLPAPPAPSGLSGELDAALHGAQREGMGLGNITDRILPSSMQIPGTSKQDLQNFDQAHAGEFANNKIGKFAGQALPLALAQFIPGLDVGADAGAGAQLASVGANAALGGLGSAATADPNHQLSAGLEGAALGGGLAGAGAALRTGLTPAAQRITDLAQRNGMDVPIPLQAGSTGALPTTLRLLQPYSDTSKLNARQLAQMGDAIRTSLGRNAMPPAGLADADALPLPGNLRGDPIDMVPKIKGQFDQAYGDVMSRWQQPQDMTPAHIGGNVLSTIIARHPDIDPNVALKVAQQTQDMVTGRVPGTGSTELNGPALQNAWGAVGDKVSGADKEEKAAWLDARSALDEFRQAGLSPEDQAQLALINRKYGEFSPFQRAATASQSTGGAFSPSQIGQRSRYGTDALQAARDWNVLRKTGAAGGSDKVGFAGKLLSLPATALHMAVGIPGVGRAIQSGVPSQVLTRALPLTLGATTDAP